MNGDPNASLDCLDMDAANDEELLHLFKKWLHSEKGYSSWPALRAVVDNPELVLTAVPKEKVALYKVLAKYEKAWETLSTNNEESQ